MVDAVDRPAGGTGGLWSVIVAPAGANTGTQKPKMECSPRNSHNDCDSNKCFYGAPPGLTRSDSL